MVSTLTHGHGDKILNVVSSYACLARGFFSKAYNHTSPGKVAKFPVPDMSSLLMGGP